MLLKGPDIVAIRRAKKMSQREFGELFGVADATVSRWEANIRRPQYDMLERLTEMHEQLFARNGRPRKEAVTA